MSYISPERLKEAIEFYKSKKPGLSADASVAKVAAKLPAGSQFIAYVSLSGAINNGKASYGVNSWSTGRQRSRTFLIVRHSATRRRFLQPVSKGISS